MQPPTPCEPGSQPPHAQAMSISHRLIAHEISKSCFQKLVWKCLQVPFFVLFFGLKVFDGHFQGLWVAEPPGRSPQFGFPSLHRSRQSVSKPDTQPACYQLVNKHGYWKSPCSIGKSSINGWCSISMFVGQLHQNSDPALCLKRPHAPSRSRTVAAPGAASSACVMVFPHMRNRKPKVPSNCRTECQTCSAVANVPWREASGRNTWSSPVM